jgi:hypothetical protein
VVAGGGRLRRLLPAKVLSASLRFEE